MKSLAHTACRAALVLSACCAFASVAALTDDEVDRLFNDALEQSRAGDLSEAISAFETILSERPAAGRVRLELALANFRALKYAAAREQAQKVLDDPATPEAVRANVRAFLAEIDRRDRRHLLTPFVSFGYIHDDNVNVGPDSSLIDIGPAVLTLAPGSTPRSDDGVQIHAGINHRYLFADPVPLFGRQAAAAWLSQVSLFRNQYFDEDDFHLNVVSLRSGPSLLASRKWGLQLDGEFDHVSVGDKDIAIYYGFNPSFNYFVDEALTVSVSGWLQVRDFQRASDQDRDAEYYEIRGAFGYRVPNMAVPVILQAGFSGFTENAETSRRSNDGWIATAGINIIPIDRTNVYFNYFHRDRTYDAPEPVFLVKRDENEDRFVAGASYVLPITGPMQGLTVNFSYTNTDNSSNVPIFAYEREQFLVTLSKTF